MPDNTLPDDLDAVLRKYGKIWIWSILSAAVAALSVRFFAGAGILTLPGIMGNFGGRNSPWSPLLMLLAFLPSLGTLASVWFLLEFLRYHILPILFPRAPTPTAPAPPADEESDGAKLLFGAFASILAAMVLEAIEALGSIVYRAIVG